ncbi:AC5 protein [Pouzolzia golden mosaic virus]|uniref:AC5 protein n=1 Tax=Pouzolzia golden mosaic virus TaxID=1225069 RepID=J7I1J7_9GEMI|nr:AC5 protein [Pouzolzia golden mosaic virus]AFQ20091.1 AC5 protein [Pouzolzia golden mosaic virus]
MVIILSRFLMIINYMIINGKKLPNYRLFLARILTTGHRCRKTTHNLITITKIVLHRSSTRFIVVHVEHLTKVHGSTKRSSISDEIEHNSVGVILGLDIFIHPHLPDYVHGLNTEPLPCAVGKTTATCNVRDAYDLPSVGYVMSLFVRLDLTWALASAWDIWALVHSVHFGLSITGPVRPCFLSICDEDSGDRGTADSGSVVAQPASYFRGGS